MTKKEQYFEFAEKFFGNCIEISRKKNADYTGSVDDNPFANFESVNVLGVTTESGLLTRMMDKMCRVASFAKKGELQVKGESVTDTLNDLANYCALLAGYIESKKIIPKGIPDLSKEQVISIQKEYLLNKVGKTKARNKVAISRVKK